MNEDHLPISRGYTSYNGPDCCQIAVYCNYCHRNHFHGWPDRTTDPDQTEHRIAHCHVTRYRLRKDSPYAEHGYLIGIDPSLKNRQPHPLPHA